MAGLTQYEKYQAILKLLFDNTDVEDYSIGVIDHEEDDFYKITVSIAK